MEGLVEAPDIPNGAKAESQLTGGLEQPARRKVTQTAQISAKAELRLITSVSEFQCFFVRVTKSQGFDAHLFSWVSNPLIGLIWAPYTPKKNKEISLTLHSKWRSRLLMLSPVLAIGATASFLLFHDLDPAEQIRNSRPV